MKQIVCERGGETIVFTYAWPLWLIDAEGLEEAEYRVTTAELGDADGDVMIGTAAGKRNILISADIKGDYETMRRKLFAFFAPGKPGTLKHVDGGETKVIDYYVEKITFGFSGRLRTVTVSLLCPDPLLRDDQITRVYMSRYEPTLQFPFVYGAPIMVARRVAERIVTIHNPTEITTGLRVTFSARATVVNPGLEELSREQSFTIPLSVGVVSGDNITITTGQAEKDIVQEGKSKRGIWRRGDNWLQLEPGDNVYRYTATSGVDALDVMLEYTLKYRGA